MPTVGFRITELETPATCFFADTYCDDTIDNLDAQRVLDAFGSQPGDCEFNPDLDIVADQDINVLDLETVLNRHGQSAPFSPWWQGTYRPRGVAGPTKDRWAE